MKMRIFVTKYFFWTLVLLCSLLSESMAQSTESWRNLYHENSFGNVVKVDYSPVGRKVQFFFDKPRVPGRTLNLDYAVDSPKQVRNTLASLKQLMVEKLSLRSHTISKVLDKISELEHLSTGECEVAHFDLTSPVDGSNLLSLVNQVNAVAATTRAPANYDNSNEYHRSLPLLKIRTIEPQKLFQLKVVVDENEKIKKFSIVNLEGDLKDFEIKSDDNHIFLRNKNGEILFIVKIDDLNEKGADISLVRKSGLDEIENVERNHYFLKKTNGSWNLVEYSESNQEVIVVHDEVVLTNQSVHHEPVVRVSTTDQYFKTYSDNEIHDLFSKIFETEYESNKEQRVDLFKVKYQSCMLEQIRIKIAKEEVDQNSIHGTCEKVAVLYIAYKKIIDIENPVFKKMNISDDKKIFLSRKLADSFKKCLSDKNVLEINDYYSEVRFKYLENLPTTEALKGKIESCQVEIFNEEGTEIVNLTMGTDYHMNSLSRGSNSEGNIDPALIQRIANEGLKQCHESLPEALRAHCNNFTEIVKDNVLLLRKLSFISASQKSSLDECLRKNNSKVLGELKRGAPPSKVFQQAIIDQLSCSKKALKESRHEKYFPALETALLKINFMSNLGLRLQDEKKQQMKENFVVCMNESLEKHKSVTDLMNHHDENVNSCKMKVVKDVIPDLYKVLVNMFASKYTKSEEIISYLEGRLGRNIKNKIKDLLTFEEINKAIEDEQVFLGALTISKVIEEDLKASFPYDVEDEFQYQFNLDSYDAMERKIHFLLGDNEGRSLRSALLSYLKTGYEKGKSWGVEIFANELLVNYEKEKSEYILIQNLSKRIKDPEILKQMANSINEEFKECLSEYSPNDQSKEPYQELLNCKKSRYGSMQFSMSKDDLELMVSSHFPKNSMQVNNLLTPIHYLNECIKKVDPFKDLSFEEYKNMTNACVVVTQMNISHNISLHLIEQYKPVLANGDVLAPIKEANSCYKKIFNNIHETAENSDISEVALSDNSSSGDNTRSLGQLLESLTRTGSGSNSLLSVYSDENTFSYDFKKNDLNNIRSLLSTLAKNPKINANWMKDQTKNCQQALKTKLYEGFREFIIRNVPALDESSVNQAGETNREVFEKLIDLEMIDLLIKFKSLRSDSEGVLNSSLPPMERVITPAMGVMALSNMVKIAGSYISKGFIFDPDRMKTELVVFKSELKNALYYINTTSETVRVADLERFFTESTIADHFALAEVAENVHRQFMNFIIDMEREDFEAFKRRTNNKPFSQLSEAGKKDYYALRDKYRNLRALVKTMTSSYDFRRIMRTGSTRGKRIVKYIKENYLLPQILGDRIAPAVKRKISYDIARLIVEDNTEGGFAEQFVHRVAQQKLTTQSNNKWSITKWLFYGKGDFDWTSLRKTDAGRKAIEYYSQYILLPKILNANLSATTQRQRIEKFESLLSEAQGEN